MYTISAGGVDISVLVDLNAIGYTGISVGEESAICPGACMWVYIVRVAGWPT